MSNTTASTFASPRKPRPHSVALTPGRQYDSPVKEKSPLGVLSANHLASPKAVAAKMMNGYQSQPALPTVDKSILKSKKKMTAQICTLSSKTSATMREKEAVENETKSLQQQLQQLQHDYKKALSAAKKAYHKALEENEALTSENASLKAKLESLTSDMSCLNTLHWRSISTTI